MTDDEKRLRYNVPPGTRPLPLHRLGDGSEQAERMFWGYKPPSQVLDWSLKLEAAGILGENMSFKHDERQAAQTLNQTFYVQNAGVIGNVSNQASVSICQTASIDVGQARQLLDQITPLIQQLPGDLQAELDPIIKQSSACLSQGSPDQGKLRALLDSARNICEGAAGSIIASGIATSLAGLL